MQNNILKKNSNIKFNENNKKLDSVRDQDALKIAV